MEIPSEHIHQYLECRMGMPGVRTLIVPVDVQRVVEAICWFRREIRDRGRLIYAHNFALLGIESLQATEPEGEGLTSSSSLSRH